MPLSPLEYLRHIVDETEYLSGEAKRFSKEEFMSDERAKRAFVRSIEIIGEAAKKVPEDLKRRHPDTPARANSTRGSSQRAIAPRHSRSF